MRKFILSITLVACGLCALAVQPARDEVFETIEKAGGVYYAYPVTESANTPAPKGYKPFYISHYGRHGSRYLISDNDYTWVLDLLADACKSDALTPLGADVYSRLETVWEEAEGRGGDLSPLGVRQHKAIAARMYDAFPEVFAGNPSISARSTIVMRCALSMDAFCESLKEKKPSLDITREASNRHMSYLNYHSPASCEFNSERGPWREEFRKFREEHTRPQRLVDALFCDADYVRCKVNPAELMWGLYWIAVDMQNMETRLSFMDIFEPQELFDLWQVFNYQFYAADSNYTLADGMNIDNVKPLLTNILTSASDIIDAGRNGATLRFGHDGNLIPLTAILGLDGCYNSVADPGRFKDVFRTYAISPMAANVQIIFFRNKAGDVIVKFMLNEREIAVPAIDTDSFPFYSWTDVKTYYQTLLSSGPIKPTVHSRPHHSTPN